MQLNTQITKITSILNNCYQTLRYVFYQDRIMSTPNNISPLIFSPSDQETSQNKEQVQIQNFDQSVSHMELGHSIQQSMKSAQKELHQKRIQALRKELDYIKSTEWEFEAEKGALQ